MIAGSSFCHALVARRGQAWKQDVPYQPEDLRQLRTLVVVVGSECDERVPRVVKRYGLNGLRQQGTWAERGSGQPHAVFCLTNHRSNPQSTLVSFFIVKYFRDLLQVYSF